MNTKAIGRWATDRKTGTSVRYESGCWLEVTRATWRPSDSTDAWQWSARDAFGDLRTVEFAPTRATAQQAALQWYKDRNR